MSFNSYIFILAFFPLVFCAYYILGGIKRDYAKGVLVAASIVFIGYVDKHYLIYFAISIVVNYLLARLMSKEEIKNQVLTLGVVLNVLSLGVFKYIHIPNLIVPLGISFVTFTQIAFLVDAYKGKIEDLNILDYVTFTLYFPKLIQGPICKYDEVVGEINKERGKLPEAKHIAEGLWFFAIGFGKKVLIADTLAKIVSGGYIFADGECVATSAEVLIAMLAYTLQIYFDFGGYSHMAIGVSNLLGISLKDNFDRPYIAVSVDDFWKRWHISLTDFLREYIYFSLGGSRKGNFRTYLNIMAIFLVSGIWHGDTLNFVVWGAIHGVAMCINRVIDRHVSLKPNPITKIAGWVFTFIYVNITWVFFRADNLTHALWFLKKGFLGRDFTINEEFLGAFVTDDLKFLETKMDFFKEIIQRYPYFNIYIILAVSMLFALLQKERVKDFKPNIIKSLWAMFILLWSIISLSNVTVFIYGAF